MSGEIFTSDQEISKNLKFQKIKSKKIDINHLLQKVRLKKNEQKKENFILFSLVCSVVAVTGILASL